MTEMADCRGIWAALESGRPVTLDDLQIVADVLPADSADYLQTLIAHEYVRMAGVKRAGSGEAVPMFKLCNNTGPEAPHLDDAGTFVDLNLRRHEPEKHARGAFKGAVRLAAERLWARGPFSPADLRAAMHIWPESRTKQFNSIWAQLKRSGEITQAIDPRYELSDERAVVGWAYRPNERAESIRQFFRRHPGETVSTEQLGCNGAIIRQAMDVLRAEGYTVTITPVRHGFVTYRVEGTPLSPPVNGGRQDDGHGGPCYEADGQGRPSHEHGSVPASLPGEQEAGHVG